MSIEVEQFGELYKSEFAKRMEAKEAEGWMVVGTEQLTRPKFSKDAKFEDVPFQTEEDIKRNYLEGLKVENPNRDFEIELILDEDTDKLKNLRRIASDTEYEEMRKNLNNSDKKYLVLVRIKPAASAQS